jgi:Cu/Zn superoxide dismutase
MIKYLLALAIVGSMAIGTASAAPAGKAKKTETVPLHSMGGSGVTGTALFSYDGTTTTVKLTVRHLKAGSVHAAHVHVARCSNPGHILYPFPDVHAGRNGIGVASTSLTGPFAGKGWSVNVHVSTTNLTVIACGNVK